jgi:hypothetical protein
MATAAELLERAEYRFQSFATEGTYTFIIRRADSATRPEFSVESVTNPNGELVSSYPASVQADIVTAMAAIQALFVASFDVTPVPPGPLSYTAVFEGPNPDPQDVTVTNDGTLGSLLSWVASATEAWVSLVPGNEGGLRVGQSAVISVAPVTGELIVGAHAATVTIEDDEADDSPITMTVNVTVLPKAEIALSETDLSFTAPVGGPNPADQTFDVENVGPGTSLLNYTVDVAEVDATWLTVLPTSGGPLGPGPLDTITVSVDVTGLTAAGTYLATIRVTDPTSENSPQGINVELVVT